MGTFAEKITLLNCKDEARVECGARKEIRQVTVEAIVDSGAFTVVINEDTRRRLGLAVVGKRMTTLANGAREEYGLTEPVEIRWNERDTTCKAAVVPGAKAVLLGAIPLEDMDLRIDMAKQRLERAHGDSWEALLL
ncbi:MAG: retroviral-like aspartic protease family protein [Treponema sp.]|jgi:clan AA aspartic protease|nr:retroviral-like aspartic protease family protein [Treponema sp.]